MHQADHDDVLTNSTPSRPAGRTAFLFPGQGGYSPALLTRAMREMDGVDSVVAAVRSVARAEAGIELDPYVADENLDTDTLLQASPEALQFLIYAASVGIAQALQKAGVTPDVYAGHSFGEISALAASGACSVEDGARIVAYRNRALATVKDRGGYMMSLPMDRARAQYLLSFLGATDVAVAGQNEEKQVVVSGATATMDRLGAVLSATGTAGSRIPSPYPFHSPVLAPAVDMFAAALGSIRWTEQVARVYSPILGRAYRPGDDMATLLAQHFTTPFDFLSAVRSLHGEGTRLFAECGGRDVLTKIVKRVLSGEPGWAAVATDSAAPSAASAEQILHLTAGGDDLRPQIRALLDPVPSAADFDRYWNAERFTVLATIQQSWERFRSTSAVPVSPAPVIEAPVSVVETAAPAVATVSIPGRDQVYAELVELYGEALEYPAEVFSENVDLEGDLGVDSVKQTDLLGRVARKYGLPPAPEGLRLSEYRTLGDVVNLVMTAAERPVPVA
jgi:acyl transferase domain-containing protein/acyl carrier protein